MDIKLAENEELTEVGDRHYRVDIDNDEVLVEKKAATKPVVEEKEEPEAPVEPETPVEAPQYSVTYNAMDASDSKTVDDANIIVNDTLFKGQNGAKYLYCNPVGIDFEARDDGPAVSLDVDIPSAGVCDVRVAAYASKANNTKFGIAFDDGEIIRVAAQPSNQFHSLRVPGQVPGGTKKITLYYQDGGVAIDTITVSNGAEPEDKPRIVGTGGATTDTKGGKPGTVSAVRLIDRSHPSFMAWANKVGHAPQQRPDGNYKIVRTEAEFLKARKSGAKISIAAGNHDWGVTDVRGANATIVQENGCKFVGNHEFHAHAPEIDFHGLSCSQSFGGSGNKFAFLFHPNAAGGKMIGCAMKGIKSGGGYRAAVDSRAPDVEIAHNLFEGFTKNVWGISLAPNANNPQSCQNNHVHHNTLRNSGVGNRHAGAPAIKVGILSTKTNALIEWNDLDRWESDNETLEIKASGNRVFNNYLHESQNFAHISNRHGSDNVYYGNVGLDMIRGIIFAGSDNEFIYNYVTSKSGIQLMTYYYHETDGGGNFYKKESKSDNNNTQRNIFIGFKYWGGSDSFNGKILSSPKGNTNQDNYLCDVASLSDSSKFTARRFWSAKQHMAANPQKPNFVMKKSGGKWVSDKPISDEILNIKGGEYGPPEWWPAATR